MTAVSASPEHSIHPEAKYWRDQFYRVSDECETLRDQVKTLSGAAVEWPAALQKLFNPISEGMILRYLYARKDMATKEQLYTLLYGDRVNDMPDAKILDVFVCKVRAKLPKRSFIETVWGRGYRLSDDGRAWLKAAIETGTVEPFTPEPSVVLRWTAEEIQYLHELWHAGQTADVCAEKLTERFGREINRNMVAGQISKRRWRRGDAK